MMKTTDEWIATAGRELARIGTFTEEHVRLFARRIQCRTVLKDTVLLAEGTVCQTIHCSVAGAFYQFTHNDGLEPSILDLHLPGEWFFNHQSFTTQMPSACTMQAYTDGIAGP